MSADLQKPFLSERKGKVIPCRWTENRKGAGTNSGESGARNLEAGSTGSGDESTGGRVKLKTITEIRQSSARNAFIPRFDTASALLSLQKGCGLWTLSCDFVHHFLLKH